MLDKFCEICDDKFVKSFSALIFSIIAVFACAGTVSADYKSEVLGITSSTTEIDFPAVTSGPGMILPDSPFYFLDLGKQKIKLLLAMGPRSKSLIHADIAGERLAELRAMVLRENHQGIQTALNGLTHEMEMAVKYMNDAASQGKDVKELAQILNERLKIQREILQAVSTQTQGSLQLSLLASSQALRISKADVEKNLPQPQFEDALADAVFENMDEAILGVSQVQKRLETATDVLQKQSSKAAQRGLLEKQKKLETAKSQKNTSQVRIAQQELADEIKKQEGLLKAQETVIQKAKGAALQAIESAQAYQAAKEVFLQLKLGGN